MRRTRFVALAAALLVTSTSAFAATITPTTTGTINSSGPWSSATGLHTHGVMVNAGEWLSEEERGLVEFDLSGQSVTGTATLVFNNAAYAETIYGGGATGGSFTIGVYTYVGNNSVTTADYSAAGTLLGSFSTAGLTVGTPFSFDLTAPFNALAGGSLGVRLQALSEPGSTAFTFSNFAIQTAAVPEPTTLLLLGTALAGAAFRRRRR